MDTGEWLKWSLGTFKEILPFIEILYSKINDQDNAIFIENLYYIVMNPMYM